MELSYDKAALQTYMDDIGSVGESIRRAKDEGFARYESCIQQYTRLYTELEEANRRAYNMLESAESMQRAADAEYDLAVLRLENAKDDSERQSAQEQLRSARARQAEAAQELSAASAVYAKTKANMRKVGDTWERYQPLLESAADKVQEGLFAFNKLVESGNSDLGEYISLMEKARSALYDGASGEPSPGHSTAAASAGSGAETGDVTPDSFETNWRDSIELVTAAGATSILMHIAGQEYSFPNTKSGAAKAYRTAVKSGNQEMITLTNELFTTFGTSKSMLTPNQRYVVDTLTAIETGLSGTFDKLLTKVGAENRKLNSPAPETSSGVAKGSWEGTTFLFDDDYVPPKRYNPDGLTIAQIRQNLHDDYGINLVGIPYPDGIADFSSISIANIPTADIVARATQMSAEEYNALPPTEKPAILQEVFSGVTDGKQKRNRNFEYADEIAAERQIPIPGLRKGYTATELTEWRDKHKFTWDEQLSGGYNLVPSVIHGNLSHTGLVSTAGRANTFLVQHEDDLKNNPEKYCWDESEAPITVSEALGKRKKR